MACPFQNLSDIFGKPNEGFHSARVPILDVAVNDTLGTLGLAMMLSMRYQIPLWKSSCGLFLLAEVAHIAFGVDTKVARLFTKRYCS